MHIILLIESWYYLEHFSQCGRDERPTLSRGRKNAEALDDLLPAFRATALPWQSMTGEPLDPPFVPDAACKTNKIQQKFQ